MLRAYRGSSPRRSTQLKIKLAGIADVNAQFGVAVPSVYAEKGCATMVNGNPSPNDLRTLLAQKKSEIIDLESKVNDLQEDIGAIERVLSMYPNGTKTTQAPSSTVQVTASELRGKDTYKQVLDYIAEKSGGRIKTNVAKRLLIEAGLTRGNPKYVYGHIYNMLKADERYEAIGKGEFQKIQPSLTLV